MAGAYNLFYRDYDSEGSSVGFHVAEPTDLGAWTSALEALRDAVEAVSLCQLGKETLIADVRMVSKAPAIDPEAQRELKWLVRGYDLVTFAPWSAEIPGADVNLLDPNNRAYMDPTSAEYAALVTQIEATALTIAGNGIVVENIALVGRTL